MASNGHCRKAPASPVSHAQHQRKAWSCRYAIAYPSSPASLKDSNPRLLPVPNLMHRSPLTLDMWHTHRIDLVRMILHLILADNRHSRRRNSLRLSIHRRRSGRARNRWRNGILLHRRIYPRFVLLLSMGEVRWSVHDGTVRPSRRAE